MDRPGRGSADTVQTGSGVGAHGQILGSWVLRACTPGEAFRHSSLQVISEDRGKRAAPAGRQEHWEPRAEETELGSDCGQPGFGLGNVFCWCWRAASPPRMFCGRKEEASRGEEASWGGVLGVQSLRAPPPPSEPSFVPLLQWESQGSPHGHPRLGCLDPGQSGFPRRDRHQAWGFPSILCS